jgi:DNA-binding CsgD family transcriptional regulator
MTSTAFGTRPGSNVQWDRRSLYGEKLRTDQIAELLVLSPHTVRTHVRNARPHLGVSSRAEALDLLMAADADPFM